MYLNLLKNPKSKFSLMVGGTILVSIILRFVRFTDVAIFGHDNSRDVIVLYKMFEYGEYIYVGPVFSVVWGYLSPIYYYLLAPFVFLLNFHPISVAVASMVANIAMMLIAGYLSYKLWGRKAGLVALVLFGLSTHLIRQGGEGLNPSLMGPFTLVAFYSYLQWLKTSKNTYIYWFAFALSFITALHPAGFFLLIPFIISYFFYKPKITLKSVSVFSVIYGALGVFPYLVQEKKLAWWTIKKFIEYFRSDDDVVVSFGQSIINFITSVAENISLLIFSDIIWISLSISIVILALLIYEGALFFKEKTDTRYLAFTILFYLITFGLLVKFEKPELQLKWFIAAFIPLVTLYLVSLINRLPRSKYLVSGIFILFGFISLNLGVLFTFQRDYDSYSYTREVSELIREDSDGVDIDIYGENPEPYFYMIWYFEDDKVLKEKYLSWFKWAKEKDDEVVYFIQTSYDLFPAKIDDINGKHGTNHYEVLYESPEGRKVYVFRK